MQMYKMVTATDVMVELLMKRFRRVFSVGEKSLFWWSLYFETSACLHTKSIIQGFCGSYEQKVACITKNKS